MKGLAFVMLGFVATFATAAGAQSVMVTDETDTVVFGNTPARVEVMNFPASGGTPPQMVSLFDRVALARGETAVSGMIPVGNFRHYALFGDVSVRFNCYASLEPWQSATDAVPKAISFAGTVDPGAVFAGDILGDRTPASLVQKPNPILGPFLGCAIARDTFPDNNPSAPIMVTLLAYLGN